MFPISSIIDILKNYLDKYNLALVMFFINGVLGISGMYSSGGVFIFVEGRDSIQE